MRHTEKLQPRGDEDTPADASSCDDASLDADAATGQYSYVSLVAAVIQYAPVEKQSVLGQSG